MNEELKTLKDIFEKAFENSSRETSINLGLSFLEDNIRNQAIKCIKSKGIMRKMDWMWFFNITEDDLK